MVEPRSIVEQLLNLLPIVWPPILVLFVHETCTSEKYQGSISASLTDLPNALLASLKHLDPRTIEWNYSVIVVYHCWILLQLALYLLIPSNIIDGSPTVAGSVFKYRCNGYLSFLISNMVMLVTMLCGWIDREMFFKDFYLLLWLSNFYGFLLAAFLYVKGHMFPSSTRDCVFSGCSLYDFYSGIEHSPRIFDVDLKHFFNNRTGITAWPLINLSLAVHYTFKNLSLDYSIIGVNVIQYIYVMDIFYYEDTYFQKLEMAYDHFGFYLGWADMVWLPFMYTLQSRYLAYHKYILSAEKFYAIMAVALVSYWVCRWSNNQRKQFRESMAAGKEFSIWGRPVTYIKARYISGDGNVKDAYLLTSGFWGICRHSNYLADVMLSLCSCMCCGFSHILPYFYFIHTVILLVHRTYRNHEKCKKKYGEHWEQYCKAVPYKLIPHIY